MFSLLLAWTSHWTNSQVAGDLWHYDVHVMSPYYHVIYCFRQWQKTKQILSPTFWILNMVMEQKYINHCPPCWTVQHYCYCLLFCDCMGILYSCWLLHALMRPLHLLTRKIISYTDIFLYSYSNRLSLEKTYDIQCGAVITRSIFFKFLTINTP